MKTFVVPLALAAALLAVPGTAHAATGVARYRYADETREADVRMDAADGPDTAEVVMDLHPRQVEDVESATLSVLMRSESCGTPGVSRDRLTVNGTTVADFDPCAMVSSSYGTVALAVPVGLLLPGDNTFAVQDLDATGEHVGHYAVDTDHSGHSTVSGAGGELMWNLLLRGDFPSLKATPRPGYYPPEAEMELYLGNHEIGAPSPPRTAYVRYDGAEPFAMVSAAVSGPQAADFAISADGCSGAVLTDDAHCAVTVVFTPGATGTRHATLTVTGEDGLTATARLRGEGRGDPPVSTVATPDGSVLLPGDTVTGAVTDDESVAYELVTFTPLAGPVLTVQATLACDAARTACAWSVRPPVLPGVYTVTARGVDTRDNPETPGPGITVVVV